MSDFPMSPHIEFPTMDVGLNRIRQCKHGILVYPIADNVIGRALELYGEFAEDSNFLMSELVRSGDVVIDVGANVGTVTACLAKKVGQTGNVYAIEPQRTIFHNLCAAMVLNGFHNVSCIHAAVGGEIGSIEIPEIDYRRSENFGAISLQGDCRGERVPMMTLDSLELDRCRLIKIDVEGMEFEVLLGARETLEKCKPFLYLEAKKSRSTQSCIQLIQELGYSIYWHFSYFFRADNFRQNAKNIFDGRGDINIICIPPNQTIQVNLPRVKYPDSDWQQDYQVWLYPSKS